MIKKSPRAVNLVKVFFELCTETFVCIIMAGVVVLLEAINLFEEQSSSKNTEVEKPKNPEKVNVILLCMHMFCNIIINLINISR